MDLQNYKKNCSMME